MTGTSRRTFLASGALLPASAAAARVSPRATAGIAADLDRYIGFGNKQSGGAGDNACGEWLSAELADAGFSVQRQAFTAPWFEPGECEIECAGRRAALWPQPIAIQTPVGGLEGALVRVDGAGRAQGSLAGAIALLELPFARWSSAAGRPVQGPVLTAFAAGARAVVVITNGPTGKLIALNADGQKPMFPGTVALLAPDAAKPFLDAALDRTPARVTVRGTGGRRPAFNLVGRIDRGKADWLVVSTPRSGWFTCAGERGPGVAVWLALARWASRKVRRHNIAFVCNSGHEYEYLGASEALEVFTPKPPETHFWLHLGANVAARDWHDAVGQPLPLPSVDPQRYLAISPELLPAARQAFAGHIGLEAPISSEQLNAGELVEIAKAGYRPAAGVFGIHRYHHTADDDARCVSATNVAETAAAFQRLLELVG